MGIGDSTYYGFTRVREASPDARDWAATDHNFELNSLILKALEQHVHNGASPITYPGYDPGDPTNPDPPTLTAQSPGGILTSGSVVGVRLSYVTVEGLETDASPETLITLGSLSTRPLTPILQARTAATPGLTGGTYTYVITKRKAGGETLPSDLLPVDITYDSNYSVTLQFDPINSYTDGTDAICIYRAAGLNAPYQLLTVVTGVATTTYTDNGTVPPGNVGITPPATSTFNADSKVKIDFASITHPGGATKLRVYVTQQSGIWGTQSLLTEVDLTGSPPTFVDYLGSEVLQSGYPKAVSQLPTNPPKLNLGTEAIGAPVLTADQNFAGYQALNLRLHNTSSAPTPADNGDIYYDTSINNVRARINGAWVNWGTSTASAYAHPAEESGGHVAANIKFSAGSAVTAKTIFDTMRNSDGTQKHQTKFYKAAGGATTLTTASTSATLLTDMVLSGMTPVFASQWAEFNFSGHFVLDTLFTTLTIALEFNGSTVEETVRTFTGTAANTNISPSFSTMLQFGEVGSARQARILWWVSGGTASALAYRRSFTVKLLS